MDEKNTPKPEKPKEPSKYIRKFREWLELLSIATSVIVSISAILSLFDLFKVSQDLPTVFIGVISGIFSLGIVLSSISFLYQKQQKQKKEIEDALRSYEQEFLTQVNLGFSSLLEEKAG